MYQEAAYDKAASLRERGKDMGFDSQQDTEGLLCIYYASHEVGGGILSAFKKPRVMPPGQCR